jgi:NADH-quinone oxidoreductase subunit G
MEMMNQEREYITIDGIPVEIAGEKNILTLIRKAGIELPTFCYHSELSVYGACRMCMVETGRGGFEAACSTPPRAGMQVRTNTERLRRYRKMILELLLSNHCRDCTACEKNGHCKLRELAERFNIRQLRFPNARAKSVIDDSSVCITRDEHKCILCGDCVRMCNEVQSVGAIDFAHRGADMKVSAVFGKRIADSPCVGCGQCAAVCPTGAIVVRNDIPQIWKALDDRETKVSCQIAPAVRVAIGREFGLEGGVTVGKAPGAAGNAIGRIVAALRRLGFDEVYDTATGADLTVLEEANELLKRLEAENAAASGMPLFTSCCPAWVQFCEKNYPELLPHVSTCRSPMEMFASVIKEDAVHSSRPHVHVAVMPCTAKKFEAVRDEFKINGQSAVDYVITTQELIKMIRESGIVFSELEPESVDMPFGTITGAGLIFGVTGGVTEAVLRRVSSDKSPAALMKTGFTGIRGMAGVKRADVMIGEREVKIAVVSGLKNAADLIGGIKNGKEDCRFDFVEVMACPGGCINGAGQPPVVFAEKEERGRGLYSADKLCSIKRSEENPLMMNLYSGVLKGRVRELLHVHYSYKEDKHA